MKTWKPQQYMLSKFIESLLILVQSVCIQMPEKLKYIFQK